MTSAKMSVLHSRVLPLSAAVIMLSVSTNGVYAMRATGIARSPLGGGRSSERPPCRSGCAVLLAKKSKKKSGGSKQKKSGFAWAADFENKPADNSTLRPLAELVASSYRARTGSVIDGSLDRGTDIPKAVWSAGACVLAIAKDDAADAAVCTYANAAACEALGYPAFDGYKSVIDAQIGLATGTGDKKFESGYSKSVERGGDLGKIELTDVERWALEKPAIVDGKLSSQTVGVAYKFESWVECSDGYVCSPGGVRTAPDMSVAELEAAVAAQGAEVRRLKEEEGLANSDPQVKSAVAELLRLKALLEAA